MKASVSVSSSNLYSSQQTQNLVTSQQSQNMLSSQSQYQSTPLKVTGLDQSFDVNQSPEQRVGNYTSSFGNQNPQRYDNQSVSSSGSFNQQGSIGVSYGGR